MIPPRGCTGHLSSNVAYHQKIDSVSVPALGDVESRFRDHQDGHNDTVKPQDFGEDEDQDHADV